MFYRICFDLIPAFFLIATAFITNKLIISAVNPDLFVFVRMLLSGTLLFVLFCNKKTNIEAKKNFWHIILISIFTTFIPSLLKAYALQTLSASRASFWGSFEPFFAAIYLYFLYGQKLTFQQIAGCSIGIIGSIFFIYTQDCISLKTKGLFMIADFLIILNFLFSRYGWIKAQEMLNKKSILLPQQLNAYAFMASGIMALIVSIVKGNAKEIFTVNWSPMLLFLFAFTILFGNMIAYTMYGYALKKYNITLISLAGLSVPLFTHLMGPFIFNESISIYFFISLSFLFTGLYVFYKK